MAEDHKASDQHQVLSIFHDHQQQPQGLKEKDDNSEPIIRKEVDDCRTPTSRDHKIPTIQSCPTTPRKKGQAFVLKRKLAVFDFFESTGREEVESFFRSCFESPSPRVKKRSTSI
ncbi:hypothetical protein CerSpe_208350 [Prunus speciosa]